MLKRRIELSDDEITLICQNTDCNKNKCVLAVHTEAGINVKCLSWDDDSEFSQDFLNEEVDIPDNKQEVILEPENEGIKAFKCIFGIVGFIIGCVFIAKIIMLVLGE